MKGIEFVVVIAGLLAVWYLTTVTSKETFVPEFLEQGNVKRTAETSASSYEQRTNHVVPTPPQLEEVHGVETPFRVNMFNSFQPV
jgi:hypothetical protein